MCTISAPPHETKPARLSQSSARGGAAQRPAAEVRTPLQAPLSARPPAAPPAPISPLCLSRGLYLSPGQRLQWFLQGFPCSNLF